MNKSPPAKRLKQSTLLDSFRRSGGPSPQDKGAETCQSRNREQVHRRSDKSFVVKGHQEEGQPMFATHEVSREVQRTLDKTGDQSGPKTGKIVETCTSRNKPRSLSLKTASEEMKESTAPMGEADRMMDTDSFSLISPDGDSGTPLSPSLEYDQLDNSEPLFSSEPESPEETSISDIAADSQSDSPSYKGLAKSELNTLPSCSIVLPPLRHTPAHTVMVQVPITKDVVPKPYPVTYQDRWDSHHVKMPCSNENLYPVEGKDGRKELKNRWQLVQLALKHNILSSLDLEEAIINYNTRYSQKWDFRGLHAFFTEVLEVEEVQAFFQTTLPRMVDLALQMPYICTRPPPLLKKQQNTSVTLSQKQAACLLANAFFCTFPRRNARQKQSEYSTFPDINFNRLFMGSKTGLANRKSEKLKCILNYFRRITTKMPTGTLTFLRQSIKNFPHWSQSKTPLTRLHVSSRGSIEDDGGGMLQVDFANKFLGGGVLNQGCVQEEIRFLLCPEMIVSRLITEELEYNECLVMIGCERYNEYTGYSDSFKWVGNYVDTTPRDEWGRRCVEVVAIDALVVRNHMEQFRPHSVRREINKAYVGFVHPGVQSIHLPAVATGNWGCGAFGGDLRLKSLIQLMAAAEAHRDVAYFTFHDIQLQDDLFCIHTFIKQKGLTVSDLWGLINRYAGSVGEKGQRPARNLYQYIYTVHGGRDADTEVEDWGGSNQAMETGETSHETAAAWGKTSDSPDWAAGTP